MYSIEDMLKMLDGGESADSLAKSFTDVLNAAIQEKKRAEADEAKRKAEAEAKRAAKVAEASKLLDAVFAFGEKYYPEIFEKNLRGSVDATRLVKAMDQARDDVMRIMPQLEKAVSNLDWVLPTGFDSPKTSIAAAGSKAETGSEKKAVEDPIMKFLKSYDLF